MATEEGAIGIEDRLHVILEAHSLPGEWSRRQIAKADVVILTCRENDRDQQERKSCYKTARQIRAGASGLPVDGEWK